MDKTLVLNIKNGKNLGRNVGMNNSRSVVDLFAESSTLKNATALTDSAESSILENKAAATAGALIGLVAVGDLSTDSARHYIRIKVEFSSS